jgi:hypothetical protein
MKNKKYTKKELELIKDFLENYDMGMYYKGEVYTIPVKVIKELENDTNGYS